jgi:hypothetical protein
MVLLPKQLYTYYHAHVKGWRTSKLIFTLTKSPEAPRYRWKRCHLPKENIAFMIHECFKLTKILFVMGSGYSALLIV